MRALAIGAALMLSGCCFGGSGASVGPSGAAPRPGARMEQIVGEIEREYPDVERHFAGMSYDESFAAGAALSQRGLPRLPDPELLAYASSRARLLASSDEACAAMVGAGDPAVALATIEALPDDELRAFVRRTALAQSLELRGGPRPLSPEEASAAADQAVARIRAALSDEERARWDVAVASAAPADACFVERMAMREASRAPDGATMVRALLEAAQPP